MRSTPAASASSSSAKFSTSTSSNSVGMLRARCAHRRSQRTGRGDVVFLDQDRIEQTDPVVARRRRNARRIFAPGAIRARSCGCRERSRAVPRTASTWRAVVVAVPESDCRKFNAQRSALTSARAVRAKYTTASSAGVDDAPSARCQSIAQAGSSVRKQASNHGRPANTASSRVITRARRDGVDGNRSAVTSPLPMSSASARSTSRERSADGRYWAHAGSRIHDPVQDESQRRLAQRKAAAADRRCNSAARAPQRRTVRPASAGRSR